MEAPRCVTHDPRMLSTLHPRRTTGIFLLPFCKVLPRTNKLIVPGWTSIFRRWVPWEFNTFNHKINKQIKPLTNKFGKSFLPSPLLENSKRMPAY